MSVFKLLCVDGRQLDKTLQYKDFREPMNAINNIVLKFWHCTLALFRLGICYTWFIILFILVYHTTFIYWFLSGYVFRLVFIAQHITLRFKQNVAQC